MSSPVLVGGERVVDVGEVDVRVFLGELRDVVGEDESDADHEIHVLGREQPQACLAVGCFAWLDESDRRAEFLLGALRAAVGAVVERLVAESADVEHDADVDGVVDRGMAARTPGRTNEQRHVGSEQRAHEDHQLSHAQSCRAGSGRGKADR